MSVPIMEDRAEPAPTQSVAHVEGAVELLFVNPPAPEGETWLRCQYRAGQRTPDGTVWPQTALAQLAALFPEREVAILLGAGDSKAVVEAGRRLGEWRRVRPGHPQLPLAGSGAPGPVAGASLSRVGLAPRLALGPTASSSTVEGCHPVA